MVVRALRPLAPHDALAQAAHVPRTRRSRTSSRRSAATRHQRQRRRERRRRSTSSSSTTRPTGTSCWRLAKRIGFELTVDDSRREFAQARRQRRGGRARPTPTTCAPSARASPRCSRSRRSTCAASTSRRSRAVEKTASAARSRSPRPGSQRSDVVDKPSPAPSLEIAGQSFDHAGRGRRDGPGAARPARQRLPRRGGRLPRRPADQGRRQAQDHGRRQQVLRDLPRRQGRARRSRGGGGYTTSFSNSVGEHTPPRPGRRRQSGAQLGRLDRGRHRDQQQRSRQARPREGQVPVADRAGELLGAGRLPPRRQGARALDAAGRRRAGASSRSRTATRRSPTCSAPCSTARTRRARSWRSTTARSR